MARADNLRADLERIRSMSDEAFAEQWGSWARAQDRDLRLMRERWIGDLEHMLPFAEREEDALVELLEAKDAYRADPGEDTRARRDAAVAVVQGIRAEERADRPRHGLAGDAYVSGV